MQEDNDVFETDLWKDIKEYLTGRDLIWSEDAFKQAWLRLSNFSPDDFDES